MVDSKYMQASIVILNDIFVLFLFSSTSFIEAFPLVRTWKEKIQAENGPQRIFSIL